MSPVKPSRLPLATARSGTALRTAAGLVAMVPLLWLGAIVVRSITTRWVAGRRVGTKVQLAHTSSVLCVEDGLWRGPAPTSEGLHELALFGVTLIVDLRAENAQENRAMSDSIEGVTMLWLPSSDGRAPDTAQVTTLDAAVASEAGITYVHCRAGEGRTGALLGALQVRRGGSRLAAVTDALAVGSLTFSQLAYVASAGRFSPAVTALHWLVDWPTERCFDIARRNGQATV